MRIKKTSPESLHRYLKKKGGGSAFLLSYLSVGVRLEAVFPERSVNTENLVIPLFTPLFANFTQYSLCAETEHRQLEPSTVKKAVVGRQG